MDLDINTNIFYLTSEESTINPYSSYPSFLEFLLVDASRESGEQCLNYSIEYLIEKLQYLRYNTISSNTRLNAIRNTCINKTYKILYNYKLEIQCIIRFIVEYQYLFSKRINSSISESMYNLMRCKVQQQQKQITNNSNTNEINTTIITTKISNVSSRKDKLLATLCEALVPYIKAKFSNIGLILHSIEWIYKLGYLLNKTIYYTPTLHLLRMVVRRVTMHDLQTKDELNTNNSTNATTNSLSSLYYKGLITAFLICTPAWYAQIKQYIRRYNRDYISSQLSNSTSIPPPIPSTPVDILLNQCNSSRNGICPICNCTFNNASICNVSGYVGCYRCFVMYVRKYKKCPVTFLPCDESSIIRIYETTL